MEILIKEISSYLLSLSIALSAVSAQAPFLLPDQPLPEDSSSIHYDVPFYSQFADIYLADWQKLGCGVASMAMVINFYQPGATSVMSLLDQGVGSGAYQRGIGWKHRELAALAGNYGLTSQVYDFYNSDDESAFEKFLDLLKDGPVVISIHNKFDPQATLGHIVVATGFEDGYIIYNDPAGIAGREIPVADFLKGWKRRFIAIS